jgi:uncharacterized phage infection (PIP) family protein YhgE
VDKKTQKKKAREKVVKEKVARRRAAIQAEAKKARDEAKAAWEAGKTARLVNKMTRTVRRNADGSGKTDDEIKERLEQNMKILEALEQEFDGTMKSREQYLKDFQEKQAQEQTSNWGGSADVSVTTFDTEEDRKAYEAKVAEEERQQQQPIPEPLEEPAPTAEALA